MQGITSNGKLSSRVVGLCLANGMGIANHGKRLVVCEPSEVAFLERPRGHKGIEDASDYIAAEFVAPALSYIGAGVRLARVDAPALTTALSELGAAALTFTQKFRAAYALCQALERAEHHAEVRE